VTGNRDPKQELNSLWYYNT